MNIYKVVYYTRNGYGMELIKASDVRTSIKIAQDIHPFNVIVSAEFIEEV